ncbi:MAG: hypothetical protein WC544_02075 [Patescibacteria group bacterium]
MDNSDTRKELDLFTGRYTLMAPTEALEICRLYRDEFGEVPAPTDTPWCRYCSTHPDETTDIAKTLATPHGIIRHTTKHLNRLEMRANGEKIIGRSGVGLREHKKPYGVDQNVILGADHAAHFSRLPVELVAHGMEICYQMLHGLRNDPNLVNAVFWTDGNHVIRHKGLVHPQWHLYAESDLYPRLKEEVAGCDWYHHFKERCLMCDTISETLSSPDSQIMKSDNFIAFVPHAARHPFETWFVPLNHVAYFEEYCPAVDRMPYWIELNSFIQAVIQKLEILLGSRFPYLIMLYNAPSKYELKAPGYFRTLEMDQIRERYHWRLRLKPLLNPTSVKENVRGYSTNPLTPTVCAQLLRQPPEKLSVLMDE